MDKNFLEYSALDAACTLEIYQNFWPDLQDGFKIANDLTMSLFPVLMFMQTRGIRVDKIKLEKTKVDIIRSSHEKKEELNRLVGRELNVDSPKQCQEYFYRELGITPYRNKAGNPTVDDLSLQRLVRGTAKHPGLRQAKLVQEIRGLNKLYGTYLTMEFDADSRIRTSFNPRGTKFGRLSSSKTVFGTGGNLQNLPDEFKEFLVPDKGYCFVEADKAGAEWVVVAYLSGDANMMNAVESGTSPHVHTASLMFGVEPEIIEYENKIVGHTSDADLIDELRRSDDFLSKFMAPNWPRRWSLRQTAKKANHGLNYDEREFQFALQNEMEISEARRIINLYHHIYPGIRIWYESVKRELMKDRTLTNCFGRTVRFLGAWNDELWKSAYSCLPQSTVVDMLNQGMVAIYDSWICDKAELDADMLAQVHDSALTQVPIEHIKNEVCFDSFKRDVIKFTSPTIKYGTKEFDIKTDFKFGLENWSGAHKERNPYGMKVLSDFESFRTEVETWETLNAPRTQ